MPKEKKSSPVEELWESLSEEDRDSLSFFSVSDWQSGNGADFLVGSVGLSQEKIEEWIRKGVLEQGTGKQFAREWLDAQDPATIAEIKRKNLKWNKARNVDITARMDLFLSDSDSKLLADIENRERILSHDDDFVRYRTSSVSLHSLANSKLT